MEMSSLFEDDVVVVVVVVVEVGGFSRGSELCLVRLRVIYATGSVGVEGGGSKSPPKLGVAWAGAPKLGNFSGVSARLRVFRLLLLLLFDMDEDEAVDEVNDVGFAGWFVGYSCWNMKE
jgi:hypothetical protein